jgi:hypothetical protein
MWTHNVDSILRTRESQLNAVPCRSGSGSTSGTLFENAPSPLHLAQMFRWVENIKKYEEEGAIRMAFQG